MKHGNRFWGLAIMVSLAVHALFCGQAYLAAGQGGMVLNTSFLVIFYPHVMLMYFLPPADPIDLSGGISVDWIRFAGKLLVAYPASLVYAFLFSAVWHLIGRRRREHNPA
jgi:hypothetical protein